MEQSRDKKNYLIEVFLKVNLFIIFIFLSSSIMAQDKFLDTTKINWNIELKIDKDSKIFNGSEIEFLRKSKIIHEKIGVTCEINLEREHIGYSKNEGYTRDEERVEVSCKYGDLKIMTKKVVCANGLAKNKIGTIYSDKARLSFSKENLEFDLKILCVRK